MESETRVVVAKSAPVAEPATGAGPVAAAAAAATGGFSPLSTPVRTNTPSARVVSAPMKRRRGRSS